MRNAGWLSIATVAAIGLFLRLYGITQSLWLDELSTWWCVQAGPREISSRVISFQGQSPLYYFLAWGSTAMVGQTEVALRLPSLLASLATAARRGSSIRMVGRRAHLADLRPGSKRRQCAPLRPCDPGHECDDARIPGGG